MPPAAASFDPEVLDQILDQVRRLVDDRLIPAEPEVDAADAIPEPIRAALRDMGLFGMSTPEAHGGLGLTLEAEVEVLFELCRASVVFRSALGTNNGIGALGIIMDGTDEQKSRYLPRIASGELIASFALTEPDAGSDAASLKTSARREGDRFVLNGTKRYITNAPEAGVFTVMARTGGPGAAGITAFLVDRDTPGLSVGKWDRKMGQRGAHTADVTFADAPVPASAIIGGPENEGQGFRTAMKVLDRGRIHLSAVCVGAAERLLAEALGYAMERKQFGARIADFQLVQAMLADSRAEIFAARAMVSDAARRHDRAEPTSTLAACCKLFCSEMVGRVADRAVQVHGGAGYMADYAVERLYRDARLFRIYEGTTQIQQTLIGRNLVREAETGVRR